MRKLVKFCTMVFVLLCYLMFAGDAVLAEEAGYLSENNDIISASGLSDY